MKEASFLKKRSKKLLFTLACSDYGRRAPIGKVFLLLFVHKKKTYFYLIPTAFIAASEIFCLVL